jgi:hypothetical protein
MNEIKRLQQLAGINEDVSGFNVGQTKQSDGHKSTVTDVDPTTQSVTWNITKELGDKEIWDDLTKIIRKFETVQVKDFHSRPKLIQLVKDLKSIRNKFSRTVVKEDYKVLKENLVGILNEIKVNNPNIPKVYLGDDQPYIILKDGSKLYGYFGDDEDSFTFENGGYINNDDFDEAVKYFGDSGELIKDGNLEYLLVFSKDVNI